MYQMLFVSPFLFKTNWNHDINFFFEFSKIILLELTFCELFESQ